MTEHFLLLHGETNLSELMWCKTVVLAQIIDFSESANREFAVDAPDQAWVTDIAYIRTWQGWLCLAVVVDLFAGKVVGWSMKPTLSRELAIEVLLTAVWQHKPNRTVLVHSDQGSQYGSDDRRRFCKAYNLEPSMSRRDNCWDNAVAESFFSSLKNGADPQAHLQDPGSGPSRYRRLHRSLLQSNQAP